MSAGAKSYLGDGVYAEVEGGMVKLTTSDGMTETNTIFLEVPVMEALQAWYARTVQEYSAKRDAHVVVEP